MSLNQLHIILFGMLISQFVLADVPVEVIGSVKILEQLTLQLLIPK